MQAFLNNPNIDHFCFFLTASVCRSSGCLGEFFSLTVTFLSDPPAWKERITEFNKHLSSFNCKITFVFLYRYFKCTLAVPADCAFLFFM